MKLKYLNSDYVPKGQLEGFPLEVIDKMIERQVEHGNPANVKVFEDRATVDKVSKGFTWSATEEGSKFWGEIVMEKAFDLFFKKYPKEEESSKEEELPLPRVIEVKFSDEDRWKKRVVIAFKNNKALCWDVAETLEDTEDVYDTVWWEEWREVQEEIQPEPEDEYEPFDFSNGVKDYLYLMDKIIVNKGNGRVFKVTELFYDDILKTSHINDFECEFLFNNCEFEDGSIVGVKI